MSAAMTTPATPHPNYEKMKGRCALPRALYGGTHDMREGGERWLPKHPREKTDHWQHRLNKSVLWGYFTDAIETISQKPFSNPVVVEDGSDPLIEPWSQDVDLEGTTLTQFAQQLFRDALIDGKAHILVDFPREGAPQQRLADREQATVRPWWVRIPSHQLTDWREAPGRRQLARATIHERIEAPRGEWQIDEVSQWRVWWPDRWEVRRDKTTTNSSGAPQTVPNVNPSQTSSAASQVVAEGENPLGVVPVVTMYFNRVGFMEALPPLERLAWLELAHWQSRSDQTHILSMARVPAIVFRGFPVQGGEKPEWGPNRAFVSADAQAGIEFAEHRGTAVEAGRQDLLDIEARMRSITAATMTAAPGDVKATAMAIDSASARTWIAALAQITEKALEQAFKLSLGWVGREGAVDLTVNSEFDLPSLADDMDDLIKVRSLNDLSQETLLTEMRRRGRLDDKLDVEAEVARTQTELSGLQLGVEPEPDPGLAIAAE